MKKAFTFIAIVLITGSVYYILMTIMDHKETGSYLNLKNLIGGLVVGILTASVLIFGSLRKNKKTNW